MTNEGYKESKCSSCGKTIIWLTTANGKNIPVNAESVPFFDASTRPTFSTQLGHVAHFADCPNANEHRKRA